jgi:hypothetical protein
MTTAIRQQAFDTLSSKSALTQAFSKTEMCRLRMKGKKCKNPVCTYAHSKSELKIKMCSFDRSCRYLSGKNPCPFPHSFETQEQYTLRTGKPYPNNDHIILPELQVPASSSEKQLRAEINEVNRIKRIMLKEDETSSITSSSKDSMDFSELKSELLKTIEDPDDQEDNVSINLGPLSRHTSSSGEVLSVTCSGMTDCDFPVTQTVKFQFDLTQEKLFKLLSFLSNNKIKYSSC